MKSVSWLSPDDSMAPFLKWLTFDTLLSALGGALCALSALC